MADSLKNCLKENVHLKGSLGKKRQLKAPEASYWVRPTFYTTPRNQESKIPSNLYGTRPSGDLLGRLLQHSFSQHKELKSGSKQVCEYGWYKEEDGKYHNVYNEEAKKKPIGFTFLIMKASHVAKEKPENLE